ncbi:DUF6895 family protein [Mycobacteroides chelonae]|uniref:DUF6895 family protein n=1 Tax=Mycobacteroides chelonae TaxID=1774 RepID=UPI001041F67E|nr:hypothetical protein [Mycobacteroides chelonae]QQG88325.1 hypothetical protein HBA99_14740 [Mycobacteroides chelonae]
MAHTGACGPSRTSISELLDCLTEILERADGGLEWTESDTGGLPKLVKLVQEVAVLALLAKRTLGDVPSVRKLFEAIAGRRDVIDQLFSTAWLRPHFCFSYGFVHSLLDSNGLGVAHEHEQLTRIRGIWAEHPVWAAERLPFRLLDDAWITFVSGHGSIEAIRDKQVYARTGLANLQAAPWMGDVGLYAITHTAMYTTDFGLLPPLDAVEQGWLGPLMLAMLLEGDYDLAGEFAASSLYVEGQASWAEIAIVSNTAAAVFATCGYVPSPSFDEAARQRAVDSDQYVWSNTYHTTLVYGLLHLAAAKADATAAEALFLANRSEILEDASQLSQPLQAIAVRVERVFRLWRTLIPAGYASDKLLRSTVDAFLIQAVRRGSFQDINALLGMTATVGPSPVDAEVRRIFEIQIEVATFASQ